MGYIDFNPQFSLAPKPYLIDVKRYSLFKSPIPLTYLRFPRIVYKVHTSILGVAAPQAVIPSANSLQPKSGGCCELAPWRQDLTFCHLVAAGVSCVMSGRPTPSVYRRVAAHASSFILWRTRCWVAVPDWASGPPAHSTRGISLLSSMTLRPNVIWLIYALSSLWGHLQDFSCLSYNLGYSKNQGCMFESLIRIECNLNSPQRNSFVSMSIRNKQILGRRDPTNSILIKIQALNSSGFFREGVVIEFFYHHVWTS